MKYQLPIVVTTKINTAKLMSKESDPSTPNTPASMETMPVDKAADGLIESINQAEVPIRDEAAFAEFLTSPKLLEAPDDDSHEEEELTRHVTADLGDPEVLGRLDESGAYDARDALLSANFRQSSLRNELREQATTSSLRLNEEASTARIEDPGSTAETLLAHPEVELRQGYSWNVALADDLPYVLKVPRKNRERSAAHDVRDFAAVSSYMEEFLPQQAVYEDELSQVMYVFQEKVDLDGFSEWKTKRPDLPPDLVASLSGEQAGTNLGKVERLVAGFQALESESGLVLDAGDNNMFYRIDEAGQLDIEIIDTGCFYLSRPEDEANILQVHDVINRLKQEVEAAETQSQ